MVSFILIIFMESKRLWPGTVCTLGLVLFPNRVFLLCPPPQRKLREISTKYQLFQKPANFEQRMLDCKRVLEGAKGEMHVLEVKDLDAEKIQTHLGGCMVSTETVDGLFFD